MAILNIQWPRDWRRSSFYLLYFSAMGALVPYWPLYLRARGFDPQALGELMALLAVARIVAPYAGGFLVDHIGHRVAVVRIAAFLAGASFLLVRWVHGFATMGLVMMTFSFFWYATLPSLEASTLSTHGDHYGRIRLWGSIGFILVVASLGPLLDRYGASFVVPVMAVLLGGLWLSTLALPRLAPPRPETAPLILKPGLVPFLAACFLMQVSYGPYYTFYSVYLAHFHYNKAEIGMLWAFAVVCEVLLFWQANRLFARYHNRSLFAATFVLAVLRWVLIAAFPRLWPLLVAAQALHAFTFGLYHAVAVRLAGGYVGPGARARAQAFYGSAAGAGAAVGALLSGYAWTWIGPRGTFLAAAGVAVIACALIALTLLRGPPMGVEEDMGR
ncbi:MAG: MFS transporter [Acidiferrobacter sp.]